MGEIKEEYKAFNKWYETQDGLRDYEKIKLEYVWVSSWKYQQERIDKLEKQLKDAKASTEYLSQFVKFCTSCGNPKDDCICGV